MKGVFVDTSAFYAVLVRNDPNHGRASQYLQEILDGGIVLYSSSFVLHETLALLQNRLGLEAVSEFNRRFVPLLQVEWIGSALFRVSVERLLSSGRRALSLTDHTSFLCMEQLGLRQVFAFDEDFAAQGFEVRP